MVALAGIGGEERYWVHVPARKPRAYKDGGLVAAAKAAKGSPAANMAGDSELIHVNKYELQQLREMWGEPAINPETGLPAFGFFKTLGKIVKGVAKIGATVMLTPVLGPVGAAAAVNAVDTAISGGDLGDIVKSAGFAAATAGAGQLGAKFAPDIGISKELGQAVGAGLGATGAGLVTGQSLEQALTGGAMAGIGTYGTNRLLSGAIQDNTLGIGDIYKGLTNVGYDISNATGIRLGGGNYGVSNSSYPDEIMVTAPKGATLTYTGSPDIGPVTSQSTLPSGERQVVDENGDIVVTAGNTNLTLGPGIPKVTAGEIAGIGDEALGQDMEVTQDEEGTIFVNGTPLTNLTVTPGSNTITTKQDDTTLPKDDEIIVTARESTNLFPSTGSTTTTKEDVSVINPYGDITPVYETPTTTTTTTTEVPNLVPTGGTYTYTPIRRGLANIGFDPFSYGQASGNQPGEFLFFTQDGSPFGISGAYNGPTTGIPINRGGTTGGTTGGGAGGGTGGGTGGGAGGGTPWNPPAGFTGVGPNTKVGDKQVVDGKTYVWGGDKNGWQWLATDNNGNQVLMPGNGATNVTSIADAFNSGVYKQLTPEETLRATALERAVEAAPTAAAATKLNPNAVYIDVDEATARNLGNPALAGTVMTSNEIQRAKLAADEAARQATIANIPKQVAAVQAAPTNNMTARSYYMDYVTPLASSYFSTGKLDAAGARGLQQVVEPFINANDLSGAQNAVTNYLSTSGLAGPAMAEGGEVEDDMVSHLMAYRQGGGHNGPGRVKGIGSGQEDKIPAWLSDGEYVWSAQDVADLGDGSTDEGVRRLDKMRQMVRKQAGRKDVKKIAKPQRGIEDMLKAVGGAV